MKKIESFYYLLWFSYAKAYRKIWGNKLASLDSNAKGSSYPITWVGLTILAPFVLFFHTIENKKSILLFSIILLIPVIIYSYVMGRDKIKWELYKTKFNEWLLQNNPRNKFILLLLLIVPIFILTVSLIIYKYSKGLI